MLKKIVHKAKRLITSDVLFPENKQLIDLFGGNERCFILGSAQTIIKIDLDFDKNDLVISMGNFHEHPDIHLINPSIHIFAASHPPITEKVLINWWERANKKLPKSTTILVEHRDEVIARQIFLDRELFVYSYGGGFPIDFTKKIMSPWSVTIIGLQMAIYLGIKNIFLVGINHDWQCIKPYKHFYSHDEPSLEYYLHNEGIDISYEKQKQPFPKERLYREYELYQQYEKLNEDALNLGLNIYNGDKYSDFDVFKKYIIDFY